MAQSTLMPTADVEIKVRYDRHGTERVCIFYEHLTTLACHSVETFSNLVKGNVPHLRSMPVLRISFLDKDNDWVDLTDRSFPKFVKCVRCDLGNDARLQIKVADGTSPAVFKPTSYSAAGPVQSKRSLDTDFTASKQSSKYQSPIELDISLKEQELSQKEYEYNDYNARYLSLEEAYGLNVVQNKSLPVCGRCHLRISKGHNKRTCQNRPCDDIRQCGNLDYHGEKKAELKEFEKLREQAATHVKRLKEELAAKRRVQESLNSTFEAKIHSYLINSDPDKYIIDGCRIHNIAVNADKAVLRKHFAGKVPENLELASKTFKSIIDAHERQYKVPAKKAKCDNSAVFDILQNNAEYNVRIPPSMQTQQTASNEGIPATQPSTPMQAVYYPPPFYWYGYGTSMSPEPQPPTYQPPPLPPLPPLPTTEPDEEEED